MRRICLAVFCLLTATFARAQQMPHYSQYLINDFVINPAIAGSKPYFIGRTNIRYQWVGITDAPRTYVLSLHGPLKSLKVGLGGHLFTDITGPTRRNGLQLAYAYHLKLSDNVKMSMGISGGLLQFTVDGDKITFREAEDLAYSQGLMRVIVPDAGAGVYIYHENWWVSLSVPTLIPMKLQFFDNYPQTQSKLANHFFANGGYKFRVSDDWTIEPSAMIKYVSPAPVQGEIVGRVIYKDDIWAGGGFRTALNNKTTSSPLQPDAAYALIGYTFQSNIMLGYSYDFTLSNIKNYSSGTHEIMLGVRFLDRTSGSSKVSID